MYYHHHIVKYIVDLLLHDGTVMPFSDGMSPDSLSRCSKSISLLYRDVNVLRPEIVKTLQNALLKCTDDCLMVATLKNSPSSNAFSSVGNNEKNDSGRDEKDDVADDEHALYRSGYDIRSRKMELLQKLVHICTLVENVCADGSRRMIHDLGKPPPFGNSMSYMFYLTILSTTTTTTTMMMMMMSILTSTSAFCSFH